MLLASVSLPITLRGDAMVAGAHWLSPKASLASSATTISAGTVPNDMLALLLTIEYPKVKYISKCGSMFRGLVRSRCPSNVGGEILTSTCEQRCCTGFVDF